MSCPDGSLVVVWWQKMRFNAVFWFSGDSPQNTQRKLLPKIHIWPWFIIPLEENLFAKESLSAVHSKILSRILFYFCFLKINCGEKKSHHPAKNSYHKMSVYIYIYTHLFCLLFFLIKLILLWEVCQTFILAIAKYISKKMDYNYNAGFLYVLQRIFMSCRSVSLLPLYTFPIKTMLLLGNGLDCIKFYFCLI